MRRKRTLTPPSSTEFNSWSHLWLLRLLVPLECHREFIQRHGFQSDHLAEIVGLGKWLEASGDSFDVQAIRSELRELHQEAEKKLRPPSLPESLTRNIQRLAQVVGLSEADCRILEFAVALQNDRVLDDTADWLGQLSSAKVYHALSVLLGMDYRSIRDALSAQGLLARSGLLTVDRNGTHRMAAKLDLLSTTFADSVVADEVEPLNLLRETVVPSEPPVLNQAHFEHIQPSLITLRHYLKRSMDTGRRGVNIFLHGDPGTGKTQLTRVLAQELGCELFEISGEDADGDAVNGERRLRAFRAAQTFFGNRRALLLFDEVEDVFDDGDRFFGRKSTAQTRKAWMNRSLEENPVPTFWLSNSIRGLDPAFVRRFDMVIELPVPSKRGRERIVREACGDLLSDPAIQNLAQTEHLAPAVIARAASVVRSIQDDLDEAGVRKAIEGIVSSTLEVQGHGPLKRDEATRLPDFYDPAFANVDTDLAEVAKGINHSRSARICLYGPPGTGKTAFGRWLAEELGMPLSVKRASDLISMWVGETERNIARAFREAEQDGAVLLLDEVDSYLQDRRNARASWQVTEVNEMLTQMEAFNGVFIASTNLMDGLDQAALRRFDLKLKFGHLTPDQSWRLFKAQGKALGMRRISSSLRDNVARLTNLTPGDFSAVARQHRFRPIKSADALFNALQAAYSTQPGHPFHGKLDSHSTRSWTVEAQ